MSAEMGDIVGKITLQSIFNAAWQRFVVEKAPPAMEEVKPGDWQCRYLTSDGRKCAVGLVIPDGHPAQKEKVGFSRLIVKYPELFQVEEVPIGFQSELHDELCSSGEWISGMDIESRYRVSAANRGLQVPS